MKRITAMQHACAQVDSDPEPPMVPEWAEKLTPAQAALLAGLMRAFPRVLDRYYLNEHVIPKSDHAQERVDKIVDLYVLTIRRRLGEDVIETVRGRGFRCGAAFHATHAKEAPAPQQHGLSAWL